MEPDDQPTSKRSISPALISIIVIAILALGAAGAYALTQTKTDADTHAEHHETTSTTDAATTSGSASSDTSYRDGAYTETGSYSTPGGTESITVNATLTDGIITVISATGSASNDESSEYQGQFLSTYKSLVVSKSINAVKLSRVAGSSLTSNGFNAAIGKIKEDAKS